MTSSLENPEPEQNHLEITSSPQFPAWLAEQDISLAFTTYQTNRLFFVGRREAERLKVHERLFDKPMGLYAQGDRLYMSTRYQLWRLDNLLAPGELHHGADRLYIPRTAYTTGDLNVHDVVLDESGRLLFVNTDFSCLATPSPNYSFVSLWQPPFISKLVAEDRCHLNGLALVDGKPTYVTACSATDKAAGWREHRVNGGVVVHVPSQEMIATGLSMPHSPRWYRGKLWLLNSGTGELGYLDGHQFVPITFCPGFVRGLAFWNRFALVGLSKLRSRAFSGLALEKRLAAEGNPSQCGLRVIDLETGEIVHWLHLEGVVEELFDVVVLPGVRQPQALGFQSEDIERLVTFPGSRGLVVTKPTVERPSRGSAVPIAGLPRQVWEQEGNAVQGRGDSDAGEDDSSVPSPDSPLKFQQVYHLNAESLAPYDAFTFPSLQQRWQTQPQQGELVGVSASVAGAMVAFAIAEWDQTAELLSLFVAPEWRQQGIGTRLVRYLEQGLRSEGCDRVAVSYQPTALTAIALEPLLQKLGWQSPVPVGEGRRSLKVLAVPPPPPRISEAARTAFEQGKALVSQDNLQGAVECFSEAIRLQPDYLAAYNQLGNALQGLGQMEAVIATYQRLLEINPNVAQAHCNLGSIWQLQGQTEAAIAAYQQAIHLKPDLAVAQLNLAKLLAALGQWHLAATHYQAVIQYDPQQSEAHYGLGQAALNQGDLELAQVCFQRVLTLQPDRAAALFDQGRLHEALNQLEAAQTCYQHLFDRHPDWQNIAAYQLGYVRRQLCDWQDYDHRLADLRQRIETQVSQPENQPLLPLSLSVFPASPALHRAVNQHYAAHVQRRMAAIQSRCAFSYAPLTDGKLRLGYVSPDFRQHSVGMLLQDLFQYHDRTAFTVYVYALRNIEDGIQAKIKAGCDVFVDLSRLSSEAAARRIHSDGIQILIDLAGYTTYSRSEILALRPAPIQCSYLGYPDTTGADFIDYLFADEWVVPAELAAHYCEEVVYLPHQFVVSLDGFDPPQPPLKKGGESNQSPPFEEGFRGISRQDYGLPTKGFVFCCFNIHRKIDPTAFAAWMRILQQVPDAVLWLSEGTAPTQENLRSAAQSRGIDPNRLIFAPHLPFNEYLTRYRLADLFLDTFSYSAGSTAVCALGAGVPLLTKPGDTNAARMGASICAAVGLDWLICDSPAAYEQMAVHLATHPDELARIRRGLLEHRDRLPLFQPQRWIADLESICWQLWGQYSMQSGATHAHPDSASDSRRDRPLA